jgi:predicted tellurium resistance membrane protein TerC
MKLLALAFLVMIGTLLVVEGFHIHVPRGYIYFSMAFAIIIEVLNMKIRKSTSVPSSSADDKKSSAKNTIR